jgi:hypothetical protein
VVQLLVEKGGALKRALVVGGRVVEAALLAGGLPALNEFHLSVDVPDHRRLLLEGRLKNVEILWVTFTDLTDPEERAALAQLSRPDLLPRLRHLSLSCFQDTPEPAVELEFPPCLAAASSPLTALGLDFKARWQLEALLRGLSGQPLPLPRLEALTLGEIGGLSPIGGAALARVLSACAPTLRDVTISNWDYFHPHEAACGAEVVVGLAACAKGLQSLTLPRRLWDLLHPPRPDPGPTFARLTSLSLQGPGEILHPSVWRLWEVMATGRLPVLQDLYVCGYHSSQFRVGGGEGVHRLARAFEAVAGTLRRLTLDVGHFAPGEPDDAACCELGEALARLRGLRRLSLTVAAAGRAGLPRRGAGGGGGGCGGGVSGDARAVRVEASPRRSECGVGCARAQPDRCQRAPSEHQRALQRGGGPDAVLRARAEGV